MIVLALTSWLAKSSAAGTAEDEAAAVDAEAEEEAQPTRLRLSKTNAVCNALLYVFIVDFLSFHMCSDAWNDSAV